MGWTSPAGWLTNWTNYHDGTTLLGFHPPADYRGAVNVNPRDAGGTVNLVLDCATFAYGTLGDQGNLERGGTYTVPRELGVAIAQLGAGTLS